MTLISWLVVKEWINNVEVKGQHWQPYLPLYDFLTGVFRTRKLEECIDELTLTDMSNRCSLLLMYRTLNGEWMLGLIYASTYLFKLFLTSNK